MGTSRSGRYLNTKGSGRSVSDYALVHSNEGTFRWRQKHVNGKPVKEIRLESGGHSQLAMDMLDKYHIKYKVVKTYPNGVRVGYVDDHFNPKKRKGINQSWFPRDWTAKDIKHAGEYVASLKTNRGSPDGKKMYGNWKGVRVGVIKDNGKIGTIFPDSNQQPVLKKRGKKR